MAVESTNSATDVVWYRKVLGSNDWKTTRKSVSDGYLQKVLPKSLNGFVVEGERVHPAKLWKDGSVLFRLQCRLRQAGDELIGRFLIMQPVSGEPRLLTWAVYHIYDPLPSEVDVENRSVGDASAAFRHVWYPQAKGKIVSEYLKNDWQSDLTFDVDAENDSLFYLQSGRVFTMTVPNLAQSSDKK